MKTYLILAIFFVYCLSAMPTATAASRKGPSWIRDPDEARRKAAEEKKDLLIVFTGHGWCASCEVLDREVFQQPEFAQKTAKSFIYAELDFTFGDSPKERQREQTYRELQEKYLASAVPMVFLVDQEGVPYTILEGYKPGTGLKKALELIEQGRTARATRDLKFAAARQVTGLKRAELLHEGLQAVAPLLGSLDDRGDDPILKFYPTVVAEIRQLDSAAGSPLKAFYDARQEKRDERIALDRSTFDRLKEFQQAMDYKGGLRFIEEVIKDFKNPDVRLRLEGYREYFFESDHQYEAGLKNVRRLLEDADLPPEQRERWHDREAFHLAQLNRLGEALEVYDRRIAASQDSSEKRVRWLGKKSQMVYMRDGVAPAERISTLKAYRDASPKRTEDWMTATSLLAHQIERDGDLRQALKLKLELLQAQPQETWFMVDAAETHATLRENDAAQKLILEAEKLLPQKVETESEKEDVERVRARIARIRERMAKPPEP